MNLRKNVRFRGHLECLKKRLLRLENGGNEIGSREKNLLNTEKMLKMSNLCSFTFFFSFIGRNQFFPFLHQLNKFDCLK